MSAKKFTAAFSITAGLGLLLAALLVFCTDPFFHYHMPWFGLEPVTNSEVYQNPGLADHADYDSIIIGSSMSENFDGAWFDEAFSLHTLKQTYEGASAENYRLAVERAEQATSGNLKAVFGNLDPGVLTSAPDVPKFELPGYLYDDSLWNDVNYLLNKTVIFEYVRKLLTDNFWEGVRPLSQAYQWYSTHEFSKERALNGLQLPDPFEPVPQKSRELSEEVLGSVKKLKELAEAYPETVFTYYYSPHSMAYWYRYYHNGDFPYIADLLEYSAEELLKCENVRLYFPVRYELISQLELYSDAAHYGIEIQYEIFEEMRDDRCRLTEENLHQTLEEFRTAVLTCDYETLFR